MLKRYLIMPPAFRYLGQIFSTHQMQHPHFITDICGTFLLLKWNYKYNLPTFITLKSKRQYNTLWCIGEMAHNNRKNICSAYKCLSMTIPEDNWALVRLHTYVNSPQMQQSQGWDRFGGLDIMSSFLLVIGLHWQLFVILLSSKLSKVQSSINLYGSCIFRILMYIKTAKKNLCLYVKQVLDSSNYKQLFFT